MEHTSTPVSSKLRLAEAIVERTAPPLVVVNATAILLGLASVALLVGSVTNVVIAAF